MPRLVCLGQPGAGWARAQPEPPDADCAGHVPVHPDSGVRPVRRPEVDGTARTGRSMSCWQSPVPSIWIREFSPSREPGSARHATTVRSGVCTTTVERALRPARPARIRSTRILIGSARCGRSASLASQCASASFRECRHRAGLPRHSANEMAVRSRKGFPTALLRARAQSVDLSADHQVFDPEHARVTAGQRIADNFHTIARLELGDAPCRHA